MDQGPACLLIRGGDDACVSTNPVMPGWHERVEGLFAFPSLTTVSRYIQIER